MVKIGILHPWAAVCQGLKAMLAQMPGIEVSWALTSFLEVPESLDDLDLLIIGDEVDGLSTDEFLRRNGTGQRSLLLTARSILSRDLVMRLLLRAGVVGFAHLSVSPERLGDIVHTTVVEEQFDLDPDVTSVTIGEIMALAAGGKGNSGAELTPREREVLGMLAEGITPKEIAAALNLGVKTVEVHKYNLMTKLGLHNQAQVTHYAIENGFCHVLAPVPA
jgi:DNA-binding NarL/FixJ family response regulator